MSKSYDGGFPSLTEATDDPTTADFVADTAMPLVAPNYPELETLDSPDTLPAGGMVPTLYGPDTHDANKWNQTPQLPGPVTGMHPAQVEAIIRSLMMAYDGAPVRVIAPSTYQTTSITLFPGDVFMVDGRDARRTRILLTQLSPNGNVFAGPTAGQAQDGFGFPVTGTALEIKGSDDVWLGAPRSNLDSTTVYVLTERYDSK